MSDDDLFGPSSPRINTYLAENNRVSEGQAWISKLIYPIKRCYYVKVPRNEKESQYLEIKKRKGLTTFVDISATWKESNKPRKAAKSWKFSKQLSRFILRFNEPRNKKTQSIFREYLSSKSLSQIFLSGVSNFPLSNKYFETFFNNVRRWPKLDLLQIEIPTFISDEFLTYFTRRVLKRFVHLTKLVMSFSYRDEISNQGIESLAEGLKRNKGLESLILTADNCRKIDQKAIKHLSEKIAHLKNLSSLDLNFSSCFELDNEALFDLSPCIGSLISLASLALDFSSCFQIDNQGLQALLLTLKGNPNLEHIKLDFRNCNINYEDPSIFYPMLENKAVLKKLHLDFVGCFGVEGFDLRPLFEVLKQLTSLSYLDLNFTHDFGSKEYDFINMFKELDVPIIIILNHVPFSINKK